MQNRAAYVCETRRKFQPVFTITFFFMLIIKCTEHYYIRRDKTPKQSFITLCLRICFSIPLKQIIIPKETIPHWHRMLWWVFPISHFYYCNTTRPYPSITPASATKPQCHYTQADRYFQYRVGTPVSISWRQAIKRNTTRLQRNS